MPTTKPPKRKLTPYEKMEKQIKLLQTHTRNVAAKVRAETKDMDPLANTSTEMLSVSVNLREMVDNLDQMERDLKRGHTLYLLAQKAAAAKMEYDADYVSEGDRQSWMRV